jgi:hypothetical protein
MKYYEIQTKTSEFHKKKLMNNNSVTANKMSLEQRQFVGKLSNGFFLDNVPELSPFSMMGYGNITTWERFRFDVHNFIASGSGILGFFVSENTKKVFEYAKFGNQIRFYPAQLLYKGEFYHYYILQVKNEFSSCIDFEKSQFDIFDGIMNNKTFIRHFDKRISNSNEYNLYSNQINSKNTNHWLEPTKIVFNEYVDFVFTKVTYGFLVSEIFKQKLEEAQITGIEFKEINIDFEISPI